MFFLIGDREKPKLQSLEENHIQFEEGADYFLFTPHLFTTQPHVQIDRELNHEQFFRLLKASLERRQKVFLIDDLKALKAPLLKHCQPHHYLKEEGYFYLAPSIRSKIKTELQTQPLLFQEVTASLLQVLG